MTIKSFDNFDVKIDKVDVNYNERDYYYNGILLDVDELKNLVKKQQMFGFLLNESNFLHDFNEIFKLNITQQSILDDNFFNDFDFDFKFDINGDSGCFSFIVLKISKDNISSNFRFNYDVPNINFEMRVIHNFVLSFNCERLEYDYCS